MSIVTALLFVACALAMLVYFMSHFEMKFKSLLSLCAAVMLLMGSQRVYGFVLADAYGHLQHA
ncbi:hypothetical protein [Paraburkholderia sp. DGU8]|uniref:hypothetical protein n=1 Tax=Paraburkholderia sp. DGU8 TaxID=3161997 RepID=UPI003465846F